ncbi:MAG TPA: NifB/NifX family molybdenum-iron cluster-binding protein [Candidatus Brocadiia bacterium]|nr:NifB/NifX family molybdenum-iron cluster-binding protein [Candidatus Brocadiia bacterium]
MKIAVTCRGASPDSPVDPRFGRASKFILVDTESDGFQVIDNAQNLNSAQGAGIQSAETVSRHGAEVVITGHCGPKAFRVLSAAGIKIVVGAQGSVAAAIESFLKGDLAPSECSDVDGHWE